MNTEEKIKIMQAWVDGKPVEFRFRDYYDREWNKLGNNSPGWHWNVFEYRIAPVEPCTIDWSHVSNEFNFMAVDASGMAWLYTERPSLHDYSWYRRYSKMLRADHFASYKRGTVDWKDSLVERPK